MQDGFRVVWYEGDERKREKVATAEAAELLCAEKAKAYAFLDTDLRQVTTRLTQGHMVHVELALRRLHEHQYLNFDVPEEADQLVRAVDWFIKNYRSPVENMPTVKSFLPLFLKAKESMAPLTHQDYKNNLEKFAEPPYGDLRLDQITTKHVADFIDSRKVGRTTKAKHFGAIRALLYFASSKSEFVETPWISHNPAVDMLHPPKPSVPRRQRYTLDEVQRLIQVSVYLRCAPLMVLRLYTMLRTLEAERFIKGPPHPKKRGRPRAYDPWAFIDLDLRQLSYHEPDTTDEANREITLYPVLIAWLKFFKEHKVPFVFTRREEDARRVAVPQKFGDGFDNLIRHTSISFRAAICGSLLETATEADNTEQIIKRHYWRKVMPDDAKAFYELTPDKFDLRTYTEPGFPSELQLKELKRNYKGIGEYVRARRFDGSRVSSSPSLA